MILNKIFLSDDLKKIREWCSQSHFISVLALAGANIIIVPCTTCTFHKYRPQNYKQSSGLIFLAELWMSSVCGHSGIIKYTLHYYIQLTCSTLSLVENKKCLTHCTLATFFISKPRIRNKSCLLFLIKPNGTNKNGVSNLQWAHKWILMIRVFIYHFKAITFTVVHTLSFRNVPNFYRVSWFW